MDVQRLREATRPEHEATEAMMPLGSDEVTLAEYRETLLHLLPLVASWEAWASAMAPLGLRPLVEARRRSHLLQKDLQDLGTAERDLPPAASIDWGAVTGAEGSGKAAAGDEAFAVGFLGALYVVEGSTLGGKWLAAHLGKKLLVTADHGCAYFFGHGDKTGSLWREVTAELAKVPEGQAEAVIGAARRTFAAYGAALSARQEARHG